MSFADQRAMLRNALAAAGLSPDAAANIANILGNASQDSLQSSRSRTDTTPDGLRLVSPDARTHVFQNLDFRAGDPDHRAQMVESSEQATRPKPAPNVTESSSPQQTSSTFRVAGGTLADASGSGDSVSVNVRSRVAKQPAGKLPITMLDRQTNTLVGKEFRTNAGGDDGRARLTVNEGQQDMSVSLQLENIARYRVITGIEYEPGVGLRVQYSTISAWDERKKETRWLHMTEQRVLTEVVDDLKGPRAHTAYIPTFHALPRAPFANQANPMIKGNLGEDLFFNLVRIGTFTGGWGAGTTKTVTQVWPNGGRNVTVMNRCTPVADTPGTKYVLFIARTDDETAAVEVRGEDENPKPQLDAGQKVPDVTYYAIEVQQASECIAFSSLNGKKASDLCGYDGTGTVVQALSHNSDGGACGTGCLQWRGQAIDVISDVVISGSSITFKKRKVHILKAETETVAATLSFTAVNAVHTLSFDGTNIIGARQSFYVLSPSTTTNTTVATVAANALETLTLGPGGLYSDVNTLRVLKKDPTTAIVIPVTDCPPAAPP